MQKKLEELNEDIALAVMLALIMAMGTIMATFSVDRIMTDYSFHQMQSTTRQLADVIHQNLTREEHQVRIIATMLAEEPVLTETTCQEYLREMPAGSEGFSYMILLPDDTAVIQDEIMPREDMKLDFASEAEKVPYYSDVVFGSDNDRYMAYAYPIIKNGVVRGILYGYVKLKDLPAQLKLFAYEGKESVYLVNGTTGDLIVDTWHDKLGNIFDENLSYRESKEGRSYQGMKQDIVEGRAGYLVFTSKTTGEDFYSCYEPIGMHNLSFQITVPESVVFADVIHIRGIVTILGVLEILAFVIYLAYMLRKYRRTKQYYQRQLLASRQVFRTQQMLFDAYDNPYMIIEALEMATDAADVKKMLLVVLREDTIKEMYCWPREMKNLMFNQLEKVWESTPEIYETLLQGENVKLDNKQVEKYRHEGKLDKLADDVVENLAFVPVQNSEGQLTGILIAANAKDLRFAVKAMEMVASTFLMAVRNMTAYQLVRQIGTMDALTGLKNRNAYQQALGKYEANTNKSLCCIYIDANGLHEINNKLGHEAGDNMLMAIARLLKEFFGSNDSYRIGGDEFVVFTENVEQEELRSRLADINALLDEQSYHISVGFAFRGDTPLLQDMIKAAEQEMYAEKRRYYAENKGAGRIRQMNFKLENLLMEKRDRDTFMSIIMNDFMGVYIVNLKTDDTRDLCKPEYFAELLQNNGYHFRASMQQYADKFVIPQEHEMFKQLLNYNNLRKLLAKDGYYEAEYMKLDGIPVRIKIFLAEDYSEENPNTVWLFEKCSNGD